MRRSGRAVRRAGRPPRGDHPVHQLARATERGDRVEHGLDVDAAQGLGDLGGVAQRRAEAEVGSKHADEPVVPARWAGEMQGALEAGASLLIAEGRESGTVGLFGSAGEVNAERVAAITEAVPPERLIFEAPRKDQQVWLIRELGGDVGLGTIAPEEVLSLETLRLGLRADTVELLPAPR